MTSRVLTWNDLCILGDRRTPTALRRITLAGRPARVVPSLATDCGFYVSSDGPEAHRIDKKWELKTKLELVLLRELVEDGRVTTEVAGEADDGQRLAEWRELLADGSRGCFVSACPEPLIDQRGPVIDDRGRMHKACTRHWEAIYRVLGEDDRADDDIQEEHGTVNRALQKVSVPYDGEFQYNGPGPVDVVGVLSGGREAELVYAAPRDWTEDATMVHRRFVCANVGEGLPISDVAVVHGVVKIDRSLLGGFAGIPSQLTTVAVVELPA